MLSFWRWLELLCIDAIWNTHNPLSAKAMRGQIRIATSTEHLIVYVRIAQEAQHCGATYPCMSEIGDIAFTWSPILKINFQKVCISQRISHEHHTALVGRDKSGYLFPKQGALSGGQVSE